MFPDAMVVCYSRRIMMTHSLCKDRDKERKEELYAALQEMLNRVLLGENFRKS